jgi:hypothetical protein
MNTRPTPETDAEEIIITKGKPTHWVSQEFARRLERERDEAREQLAEIEDKMRVELGGHPNSKLWGEAGLIAATMRRVDALDVVTAQRDRLAEALRQIRKGITEPTHHRRGTLEIANEALAAVKG